MIDESRGEREREKERELGDSCFPRIILGTHCVLDLEFTSQKGAVCTS